MELLVNILAIITSLIVIYEFVSIKMSFVVICFPSRPIKKIHICLLVLRQFLGIS